MGHAVRHLFEAIRYKLKGRGLDSPWRHWHNSSGRPEIDSVSNKNEYQEYFLGDKSRRCLGLTNLLLSCADSIEILRL